MSISDNKIMDFVDGRLNDAEAKEISEAIKLDPELQKKAEDLKAGLEYAEMGYLHEVMNAPDPTKRSVKRDVVTEKKNRFWSSIFGSPAKAIPAMAACLAITFVGGVKYSSIMLADISREKEIQVANLESEVESLKINLEEINIEYREYAQSAQQREIWAQEEKRAKEDIKITSEEWVQFASLDIGKKYRNIENIDGKDKVDEKSWWWIKDNIALSVITGPLKNNKLDQYSFVSNNRNVLAEGVDKNGNEIAFGIQYYVQTLTKANISIEFQEGLADPEVIMAEVESVPGKIISTKLYRINNTESEQKIIIKTTTSDGKKNKIEFFYNLIP